MLAVYQEKPDFLTWRMEIFASVLVGMNASKNAVMPVKTPCKNQLTLKRSTNFCNSAES